MQLTNLSDIQILELQYSLLEELKQKKTDNVTVSAPINIDYDEFIKQRFENKNGHFETDDEYITRLSWFNHGCPAYKKLSKILSKSLSSIHKMASKNNWKDIRKQAVDLGYNPKNNLFIDNTHKTVKRDSKEYNRFRESVLKRDKVCQCCGSSDNLEVHHALSFNQYNSLGADTNNGIVLCKDCHTEYHSKYGYKKRNNPITLAQFLRDYGLNQQIQFEFDATRTVFKAIVLTHVKNLQNEYAGDCPINVLISKLEEFYMDKNHTENIIQDLIQKGECYQPTTGYIRVVD